MKLNRTHRVVIPARFQSQRFPGKLLQLIDGLPIIIHVLKKVEQAEIEADMIVATDNQKILDEVNKFGYEACMTSLTHTTGTDRIAEVAKMNSWSDNDIILNIQGDEPFIAPELIKQLLALQLEQDEDTMSSLYELINDNDMEMINNPNVVKVILNKKGFAQYFSRSPIPFDRSGGNSKKVYKRHIGIYAYTVKFLNAFVKESSTELEKIEKLEQLRALEMGKKIAMQEAQKSSTLHGIDTPEDLERAIAYYNKFDKP